jgi:hypothetical protein
VVHVDRLEDAPDAVADAHQARREGADTTLHLRLTPEDQRSLKTILGWMLYDPALHDSRERPSYSSAVRYAMRRCLANPPKHVEAAGG